MKGLAKAISCSSSLQAPNPANIRPLHILQQSLENIRRKWDKNEKEYPWICDQLKSMRQDLTVGADLTCLASPGKVLIRSSPAIIGPED